MCGDRAPLFPQEQQFVTQWGCIHPEKQLNANKKGKRIKGFMYDKWLKEVSMCRCMEQWVPSMMHHLKLYLHTNYLRKKHIANITHHYCSYSG